MATGVQSGFRTNTGSQSGAGGNGASSKIPFQKGLEKFLAGFTTRQKITGIIVFCVMITAIISLTVYQKSTAFVPLYPEKLSSVDAGKISFELDRMSIDYTLVEGGAVVMVPPSCRTRVRLHMAQLHLPQRLLKKAEGDSTMLKTTKEMEYNRQLALQAELSESIRSLEGIADAYVTIARPERDYFKLDSAVATASVIVSMVPGSRLVPAQVKGITKLVAASVSELEDKNVTVVDQSGIVINSLDDDAASPMELTGKEQEKKISYEQYMQRKVQSILDKAFGPDKAIVVIDTTIDASSSRTERYVVGDASSNGSVVTKIKEAKENYLSGDSESSDTGAQMSFRGSADKSGKGQSYNKNDTVKIIDVNKVKTETVTPAGAVKRITASVLVDNLSPSQVDKVREIVKGAIGYDEEQRNDTVTVASLPFTSNVVQELQKQRIPAAGLSGKGQSSGLSPLHLLILNAVIISLLVPFIVFSMRRRESAHRRSGLFLAAAQSATSCEIADLTTEKCGRGLESTQTRINTSERFAQFATERPSEVAGLLKSTWLGEKMR
ncbi:MAG: flagellar basal-body MS-ring/collar protein FliF [Candidatus Xenobiia bacterium LiM19]